MDRRDPTVFGRNVRAFRALRGWGVRELAERAGISTKTVVKIERGEGCTVRTEQKIAVGFAAYLGRLWDDSLLSDDRQRVIRDGDGRWFFADLADAESYHRRLLKASPELYDERLRSDPDEIQCASERHRLGHAGLASAFVQAMGRGLASGYFQYNYGEVFRRDTTPPDGFNYTYWCLCLSRGLRIGIRGQELVLNEGDSLTFEGNDEYWVEPLHPVVATEPPATFRFLCLKMLELPKPPGSNS